MSENDVNLRRIINTIPRPADWETNYNNYFTIKSLSDIYSNAPEWVINKFYYYNDSNNDSTNIYKALDTQPGDWYTNWSSYYIFVQNDFPKCPPDWKPRTFYINSSEDSNNKILTLSEPSDWPRNRSEWDSKKNSYFTLNSSTLQYDSCSGISVPNYNINNGYIRKTRNDIQRSVIHTGVVVSNYSSNAQNSQNDASNN